MVSFVIPAKLVLEWCNRGAGIQSVPDKNGSPTKTLGDDKPNVAKISQRLISKFNIDIALCMFCGLCTEACPTNAIHFTREFEGATQNVNDLIFRFIKGAPVTPYKPKPVAKGLSSPSD